MRNTTLLLSLFGLFVLSITSCSVDTEDIFPQQEEILLSHYDSLNPEETFWEITQTLNDVEMRGYAKFVITENDTILLGNFCYKGKPCRFTQLFENKKKVKNGDIMVKENNKVIVVDLEAYRADDSPRGELFNKKYRVQTIELKK